MMRTGAYETFTASGIGHAQIFLLLTDRTKHIRPEINLRVDTAGPFYAGPSEVADMVRRDIIGFCTRLRLFLPD